MIWDWVMLCLGLLTCVIAFRAIAGYDRRTTPLWLDYLGLLCGIIIALLSIFELAT